jgi:hypothetical protein
MSISSIAPSYVAEFSPAQNPSSQSSSGAVTNEADGNDASGTQASSNVSLSSDAQSALAAEGITTTTESIGQAFSGLLFTAADTNKDGTVSKQEFETMMGKAGDTTAQADALFQKYDPSSTSSSGLSQDAFEKMVASTAASGDTSSFNDAVQAYIKSEGEVGFFTGSAGVQA